MRMFGVARRALALLDDDVERLQRARAVDDLDEPRQRGHLRPDLQAGIADEDRGFAVGVAQGFERAADAAIEVADGRVILRARHQPLARPCRAHRAASGG